MTPDAQGIMARVVAREPGAFGELDVAYRRLMCQHIGRYTHGRGTHLSDDDVNAIAADWLIWLWDHAEAWRGDGGSSPVNWSRLRVPRFVYAYLAGRSVLHGRLEHDVAESTEPAVVDRGESALEMLQHLAAYDDRAALALELLKAVVPAHHIEQLLEALIGAHGATVLSRKSLSAVRRQRARHQLALRERIDNDERFVPLAGAFAARVR